MSTNTPNYKLTKIDLTDAPPDITVLNSNWDTIDAKIKIALDHLGDSGIHVTPSQKTTWDSKADGNHNHNANYAPLSHSNDGNIHVTTGQKSSWDNKASATHGHSLSSLGAAPSGYGSGDSCVDNMIKNPLDLSLKNGTYGFNTYDAGSGNSPEADFLGYIVVYSFGNTSWHYVRSYNNLNGRVYENSYDANTKAWVGWIQCTSLISNYTLSLGNTGGTERSYSFSMPFTPFYTLCDTGCYNAQGGTGTIASRIIFQGKTSCSVNVLDTGYVFCTLSGKSISLRYKVDTPLNMYFISM